MSNFVKAHVVVAGLTWTSAAAAATATATVTAHTAAAATASIASHFVETRVDLLLRFSEHCYEVACLKSNVLCKHPKPIPLRVYTSGLYYLFSVWFTRTSSATNFHEQRFRDYASLNLMRWTYCQW